jgi:hypothetical protein
LRTRRQTTGNGGGGKYRLKAIMAYCTRVMVNDRSTAGSASTSTLLLGITFACMFMVIAASAGGSAAARG